MAFPRRSDVARRPTSPRNRLISLRKRRYSACSVGLLLMTTLFAIVMTPSVTGTNAQEPLISASSEAVEGPYVAGSQLLLWWSDRGDADHALELLEGVQQCPEDVNIQVDSEFLQGALLTSCSHNAAGDKLTKLIRSSEEVVTLSREETTSLCKSEVCAAWLSQAVEAQWLPECRYRQSKMSVRSLAETLLRIREDLVASTAVIAPNASMFQELYVLNQLANLLNAKDEVVKYVDTSIMQVARRLEDQEYSSLVGSSDSAIVELPSGTGSLNSGNNAIGSTSSSSTGSSSGISGSSSKSDSAEGYFPEGSYNSSDTVGFTSSDVGPHASSTPTTMNLTPSYAYVVGAWVLFNSSYFFLMRRK